MKRTKEYMITEHTWRLLRALFILIGTGLWLYTEGNEHVIMGCFIASALCDQLHGYVCYLIESIFNFKHEHDIGE